jgi:hypothetical protein
VQLACSRANLLHARPPRLDFDLGKSLPHQRSLSILEHRVLFSLAGNELLIDRWKLTADLPHAHFRSRAPALISHMHQVSTPAAIPFDSKGTYGNSKSSYCDEASRKMAMAPGFGRDKKREVGDDKQHQSGINATGPAVPCTIDRDRSRIAACFFFRRRSFFLKMEVAWPEQSRSPAVSFLIQM